ncbi:hypothetical protein HDU97_006076 [Phlyctochytrium planicorne]|nr:hypothetical protein HDU97_006076 [Phlyctochytrium planicorne]
MMGSKTVGGIIATFTLALCVQAASIQLSVRQSGGNQVTFQLPRNVTVPPLFAAISESQTGRSGATFNFSATFTSSDGTVSFRTTDKMIFWPADATRTPYLLYSTDGVSWLDSGSKANIVASKPLNVGFAFSGTIADFGWSYSQNQGVLKSTAKFGNSISVSFLQFLSFNPAEAYPALKAFVSDSDLDLLIVTTSGHYDTVKRVSAEFPAKTFVTMSNNEEVLGNEKVIDPILPKNFNVAFARQDVARYLSGIVAGSLAVKGGHLTVGYISAFADAEIVSGVNAFFLGLRKVSPDIKLAVRTINNYYDEFTERECAKLFVSENVTILSHQTDSLQPMKVITSLKNGYGVGSNYDSQGVLGNHILTAALLNWEPVHTKILEMALDATLSGSHFTLGFAESASIVSPLSGEVPYDTRELVALESARLSTISGEPLFCGPLTDNQGVLRTPVGKCKTELELASENWYLQGIDDRGLFVATPPYEDKHLIPVWFRWIMYVLTIIAAIFLLALVYGTSRHSNTLVMKAASSHFCQLMTFSCFVALGANILFGLDDSIVSQKALDASCTALPWVVSVPSTIGIASLFAKVWRVRQIFMSKTKLSTKLPDSVLFKIVAVIIIPDLIINVIWTAYKPLRYARITMQRDEFNFIVSSYGGCIEGDGGSLSIFVFLLVAYKALILVYGSILAQQTQSVPSALNESKYIAFCIFIAFEVLIIIFPLNYIMTSSPIALFIFRAGSNLLVHAGIPSIVMVPKFLHIYYPNAETSKLVEWGSSGASEGSTQRPSNSQRLTSNNGMSKIGTSSHFNQTGHDTSIPLAPMPPVSAAVRADVKLEK